MCRIQHCEAPAPLGGTGLCLSHYNQFYISGMELGTYIAAVKSVCQVPGCDAAATTLDHDHTCCHKARGATGISLRAGRPATTLEAQGKRCGRCNRGFVCVPCNRAIGMVERKTAGARRMPRQRRLDLLDYVVTHTP